MIGYIILTRNAEGAMAPDWDGRLHSTAAEAQEEFRLCTEALGEGHCVMAMVAWRSFTYTVGSQE